MKRYPVLFTLSIIILLFAFSIYIRKDNINKVMPRHHEWITAHTLTTLKIWQTGGISKYHYSPIYTYPNPTDKHTGIMSGVTDQNGDAYYISYPPFAFQFAYFFFWISNTTPSVLGIQILNIFLHLICCILVYMIVIKVSDRKLKDGIYVPALTGIMIYIFSAGNLWFHLNLYFVDTLAIPFFLLQTYLAIILFKDNKLTAPFLTLLGVTSFLFSYTEWLGLFSSFVIGLAAFIKGFRNKKFFIVFLVLGITSASAVAITLYQYSSIAGMEALKDAWDYKFKERTGSQSENSFSYSDPNSPQYLFDNFKNNYKPSFIFLYSVAGAAIISIFFKVKKQNFHQLKRLYTTDLILINSSSDS